MKNAVLLFALLSSLCVNASELEQVMDKKTISVGSIDAAPVSITLIRNNKSPRKVYISFSKTLHRYECSSYEDSQTWVDGHYVEVCANSGTDDFNNYVCHEYKQEWQPGYYDHNRVCSDYDEVPYNSYKKLSLNFKKAIKLKDGEEEKFKITLKNASGSVNVTSEVLESRSNYKIKQARFIFKKNGIKFIAIK